MKFEEIDISSFENILMDLKKKEGKLYAWNYQNESITKAEVTLSGFNKLTRSISCKSTQESAYYLADMITGSGKLNFYIPDKSIYFTSELKMLNEELIITWPKNLYLNDRREVPRAINFSNLIEVEFECDGKKYKKNCFDIGPGGLSFILSSSEVFGFKKNDVIPFINLNIDKNKMEVSGKIQSIDKIDPKVNKQYIYKVTRISLRFIEPDSKLVTKIKKIINDHQIS